MKNKFLPFLLVLYILQPLSAQQISSYIISCGSLSSSNLSSTAGESVIGTSYNTYQLFSGFNFMPNTAQTTYLMANDDLSLYPTIVRNNIHIRGQYIWLKIHDSQGYPKMEIRNNNSEINVNNLPPGFYIITIKTQNSIIIKKIIKL